MLASESPKELRRRITGYMILIKSDFIGSTRVAKEINMLEKLTFGIFACLTQQKPFPNNDQVTRAHSESTRDGARCDENKTELRTMPFSISANSPNDMLPIT
jgi:hypothetical protein